MHFTVLGVDDIATAGEKTSQQFAVAVLDTNNNNRNVRWDNASNDKFGLPLHTLLGGFLVLVIDSGVREVKHHPLELVAVTRRARQRLR